MEPVKNEVDIHTFETKFGSIFHADSMEYMLQLKNGEVNLIMTSPPLYRIGQPISPHDIDDCRSCQISRVDTCYK